MNSLKKIVKDKNILDELLKLNRGIKSINPQQNLRIKKIQVNRGLGTMAQNTKILKKSIEEFRLITGQHPIITKAKKSIASFKVRDQMEIGITVTLRREKMNSFLNRLIHLVLPRITDFQGLNPKKFDKNGNYNFSISDQLIFPEIDFENVDQTFGFNITIVTSAKNSNEGREFLTTFGLPFHN